MIASLREPGEMPIAWTKLWRSSYGALFVPHKQECLTGGEIDPEARTGGPDAHIDGRSISVGTNPGETEMQHAKELVFRFSPDANFRKLIEPEFSSLPVGSDAWAIAQGWTSVTPLRASFAEPDFGTCGISGLLVAEETDNDQVDGVRVLRMKL